ncbi:MAG TPA: N-6 DNA methylase [Phycisphaerae bacterium]|nr:N-6 DNA methylase [Phycisphaerae bacterium]HRW54099.1 N-6 DNA methylase [Phycisphaerae bacterium]
MAAIDSTTNPTDARRKLGQVFTPSTVAEWMTAWACAHRPARILEPSAGDGVFIDEIERRLQGDTAWRPRVWAHEIDKGLRSILRAPRRSFDLRLSGRDFVLDASRQRYDACVANPPYIRHHALSYDAGVYRAFDGMIGERISRMTNLYGLFLLRIWDRLDDAGRAAVIVPAEWLNADFGRPLKRYLLSENAIDGIVSFADDALIFGDALTTAVIMLLRRGRHADEPVRVATLRDAAALAAFRFEEMAAIAHARLDPSDKWTNILAGGGEAFADAAAMGTLADVADCSRGIATGANGYFTLTESERTGASIDPADVTPCITKAIHASANRFDSANWDALKRADRKVWLLTPREPLNAAVEAYLERGCAMKIHARYLPSHRPVWYRPEKRAPAPIWAPVFVRGRFRFIHNAAEALNLTAFHGLYPHNTSSAAIDALLGYLWSDAAQRAIGAQSRLYAGGLRKLEPRDVLSIPIPMALCGALRDY